MIKPEPGQHYWVRWSTDYETGITIGRFESDAYYWCKPGWYVVGSEVPEHVDDLTIVAHIPEPRGDD